MTLQDTFRAGFASIVSAMANANVSIVSNGQTATGLKSTLQSPGNLTELGERGNDTGIVRVNAASLTTPEDGATIIIDGEKATVQGTRLDPVGAILTIEYMLQKPVTAEDLI